MTTRDNIDEPEPPGPPVTLHTDDDGTVSEIVLGETIIAENIGPNTEVDLTESMYEAGFELTTRDLQSFLTEVSPDELDEDDPIRQLYDGEDTTEKDTDPDGRAFQ